ncbi:MAG: type II toxin-antitoxin system RelB/DinJ family antitoxin [Oscillospiraceae bacterium]|jgi:DNA-damage-inducible protein J|nr:type II toxin-antitoxin system RelB/DinJ family antitoxin [Oscillospiraceae bacterium]
MSLTNVSISMDEETKKRAENLFSDFGMNMSTAINVFIRQVIRENRIPFIISAETPHEPQAVKGSGKGKIWMSDDFDAPLEELKEYME